MLYNVSLVCDDTGDGLTEETAYRPAVYDAYPIKGIEDITRKPIEERLSEPALITVGVVIEFLTLELMEADSNLIIVSADPQNVFDVGAAVNARRSNELPDAAEFGLLRAWLAQKQVKQATINQFVPAGAHAYWTRAQIVEQLKLMCLSFPKAIGANP